MFINKRRSVNHQVFSSKTKLALAVTVAIFSFASTQSKAEYRDIDKDYSGPITLTDDTVLQGERHNVQAGEADPNRGIYSYSALTMSGYNGDAYVNIEGTVTLNGQIDDKKNSAILVQTKTNDAGKFTEAHLHLKGDGKEKSKLIINSKTKTETYKNSKVVGIELANVDGSNESNAYASLTFKNISTEINVSGIVTGWQGTIYPKSGGIVASNEERVALNINDSDININFDVTHYDMDAENLMSAGISLAADGGGSHLKMEGNSVLNINSDLAGITLFKSQKDNLGSASLSGNQLYISAGNFVGESLLNQFVNYSDYNPYNDAIGNSAIGVYSGIWINGGTSKLDIATNETYISGATGVFINAYNVAYSDKPGKDIKFTISSKNAILEAKDTHGFFGTNKDQCSPSALYLNNVRNAEFSGQNLILKNNQTYDEKFAIHANNPDKQSFRGLFASGTKVESTEENNLDINVSAQGFINGADVWGIYAKKDDNTSNLIFNGDIDISAKGDAADSVRGIYATDASEIAANRSVSISSISGEDLSYAVYVDGNSNVTLNAQGGTIFGGIFASDGEISLNSEQVSGRSRAVPNATRLIGYTQQIDTSAVKINLAKTTDAWYVTKNSQLSSLQLSNDALLDFDITNVNSELNTLGVKLSNDYKKVETKEFTSNSGQVNFRIDMQKDNSALANDQLIVAGKADGNLTADINITNDNDSSKLYSNNWLMSQGADSNVQIVSAVTGKNAFFQRGGVSQWQALFLEGESTTPSDDAEWKETGIGEGDWYLVRNDSDTPEEPDNPNPDDKPTPNPDPVLPPEVDTNLNIGTSASQALAYFADLDDLRERIGEVRYGAQSEVRYGAQSGAWAKAFTKQDRMTGSGRHGFKQEGYGINVGYDTFASVNEEGAWLVGGALRYGHADQEGYASTGRGSGDLDEYSAKLYATYMHKGGSYADFVVQAGHYEQELDGLDNTGKGTSHADYDTFGTGVSVEVGHMFTLNNGEDDRPWFNHWFIEPQAQLAYFFADGADYTTSTGLKVKQDNADFLTGRLGVVIGKKFNYGGNDELDKRYFQIALIGGIKHEFLGEQSIKYTGVDGVSRSFDADDIDGTRAYYGVNLDWQLSDDLRIYAQFDREEGEHYEKDYDVKASTTKRTMTSVPVLSTAFK